MIAKKYRVPRQRISLILKKGDQHTSKLFIVRQSENTEQFNRYRVIISRKLHPKAARRNHLRRQIYETIRLHFPENNTTHHDNILIPKKNILEKTYQEIEADIRANIINR